MPGIDPLPRAAAPFVSFGARLRAAGFAVAPEQTQSFVAAVGLLGPRSIGDVRAAARATLAPAPEQAELFNALFNAHFLGASLEMPDLEPTEEEIAVEPEDGDANLFEPDETNESGADATAIEALAGRAFPAASEADALRLLRRLGPTALPRRTSRRLGAQRHGERPDMRRALRDAVKRDGEVVRLPQLARRTRQRRVLLLIDVSGSMKGHTDGALRVAHTLARTAERAEVFTVGTRLTRITRMLRHKNQSQALAAASAAVADWDGGTRLGDALAAFLAVPRYAGFARSALVVILSDGLERGDPSTLVAAMVRLSRLAASTLWLSPLLATGAAPETEALRAIAPHIDRIGAAPSSDRIVREILSAAATRRSAATGASSFARHTP